MRRIHTQTLVSGKLLNMELKTLAILVLLAVNSRAQLKGLRFLDNNQSIPWIQENGNATFTFSPYPVQLALCMKLNLDFARYTTYAGLIYVEDTATGNILLSIEISNNRGYNFLTEFPGRSGDFEWHFGKEKLRANFLRKWTWFCFSMDYEKQTADFAVNGRMIESLYSQKLSKDVP